VEGEITGEDIVIPRFHQVQSVGPLSEKFEPGSLVYNKEVAISDGSTPVHLTVLRIKKRYIENVEYGGDAIARVFDSIEEVKGAGGWIDWRDNERPPFSPMLQTLILIRSPFEDHPLFPYQLGDHAYGLAMWTLRTAGESHQGAPGQPGLKKISADQVAGVAARSLYRPLPDGPCDDDPCDDDP
jgi:hypothetical protein